MQANTVDKIQNKIYFGPVETFAEKTIAILAVGEQMFYPSVNFNVGFIDPTDKAVVTKVKKLSTSMDDLSLIASANFKTGVNSIIGGIAVGNKTYSASALPAILKTDRYDLDTVALVDADAFKAYLRIYDMDSNS